MIQKRDIPKKKRKGKTYRAPSARATLIIVLATAVLAVGVLASATKAIAGDLDSKIQLLARGGQILENRQPGRTVAIPDTEVQRGEVAPGVGVGAPLAGVVDGDAGRVDVVLGRGVAALPLVVVVGVRAGEVAGGAGLGVDGDGFGFGARVVGAADGDVGGEFVLDDDVDLVGAGHAELVGHAGVGEPELAVLALDAADGLAGGALGGGPLRLLVSSGAGVGAEGALGAAAAARAGVGGDGLDVGEAATLGERARGLDTGPATETHPVDSERAVVGRESVAVKLAIGEVGVETSAVVMVEVRVVTAAGAGGGRRGGRRGRRRVGARAGSRLRPGRRSL